MPLPSWRDPSTTRRARGHAVLVGLVIATAAVDAEPGPESPSVRLVYSRTAEASSCPAEPALRAAVAARFGYDPFFPWAKATVVVQMSRLRALYVARVQLLDDNGIALGSRELSSAQHDCSEIFDATALAISIAVDAASKQIAPAPPEEPVPPPPAPPSPPAPPVPAPPAATPAAATPAASLSSESTPVPPADTQALHPEVGVDVLESLGVGPSASPGVSLFARGRMRWWSLSLEVRADWPGSVTRPVEFGGGRVQSWVAGAGLASCLHVGLMAVCAVGMAGSLQASGHDIDPQFSRATWFAMAGGRLGLEWPVSRTLALRVRVDGVVNLDRVSLVLGNDDVWKAPPVAGTLGGGFMARFR